MSFLGYYVHDLSPFIVRFGDGFGLRWYGMAYVLAFVAAYLLYRWLAQRGYSELSPDQVGDFITWGAMFGVLLGGRLGYVLFYDLEPCMDDPARIFQVWKGGMSSHGGMIGLILFSLYYARRKKVSWRGIGDNLCVVAPVGLFFGRIANFLNGELYGKPSDVPWAVVFPPDPLPRHPSQLYEASGEGLFLFVALWWMRTRCRTPRGLLIGMFFILYAVVRIICEVFREPDPAWAVWRMSPGQFLSVFLVLIGLGFAVYALRHPSYERGAERIRKS